MDVTVPEDLPGMRRSTAFPAIPPAPPQEHKNVAAQRYLVNVFHYFRKPLTPEEVMAVVVSCLDTMDDETLFGWIETLMNGITE